MDLPSFAMYTVNSRFVLLGVHHLHCVLSHSGGLILVVVVDLVIPEKSLISVTPEEVPRSDVLVRVFDSLFQGRKVAPVLPMLVPQVPGVDAAEDQARDYDAMAVSVRC
jgi:hypothetical protein